MADEMIVLDTPEQIEAFQLLRLRGALKLEIRGLSFKQGSVSKHVRETYSLKCGRKKTEA